MKIKVETYSGYKADESPRAFYLGPQRLEVMEILDRWYDPHASYFRIRAGDDNIYVLKHREDSLQAHWTMEAFRTSGSPGFPIP